LKYLKDLSKLVFAKASPVLICWQFVGSESTEPGLSNGSVVLVIQFLQGRITKTFPSPNAAGMTTNT